MSFEKAPLHTTSYYIIIIDFKYFMNFCNIHKRGSYAVLSPRIMFENVWWSESLTFHTNVYYT